LTKKLAIVQGPPGTGKTHVSVVALRLLLSNTRPGDPPIIVATQTNHALDQLLRHVAQFERQYVRVGGRSADPEIKKHTLFELGKSCAVRPPGSTGSSRRQMQKLAEKIADILAPFKRENAKSPLSASLFFALGLITQAQHDSLIKGAEGWVHSGDQTEPMAVWLDDEAVKFEVAYKTENFGFVEEEIDLEYEQLKELEAEQGLEDEDFESLRGQYISLKEGFTTRKKSAGSGKSTFDAKYLKTEDMWKIPPFARGGVYALLQQRAKDKIRGAIRSLLREYESVCTDVKVARWERQSIILRSAKVVGMTTTGLSKYRAMISTIKPRIILIEEAAEVIEAPVTAACVESLQHLILVGDHQQLQGHCAVQDLEGDPFYLNISMFERLVHNDTEFKRLCKQRRMIPEIRTVLNPIYDDLEDHPCVLDRPGVPGMGEVSSYFFCHTWPESSDSLMSRYNEKEAKMVVGFFLYLCMNGVDPQHISVVTFYNGQRKKILKELKSHPLLQGQYTRVFTVDSYQGEENEIVLLSLVRSNEYGTIGFLSIENRVCVALSRARRGLYIFGNAESLAIASGLWWEVIQIMRHSPKRIGYMLPLTCSRHKNKTLARGESASCVSASGY
jgi:helicase required for RNAi-mediated heterochromatin assembly 1